MSDIENALESRVARNEANIESIAKTVDSLSKDVRQLTQLLQKHSEEIEAQIKSLLVAVTSAAGPRKTDWHLVLGGVGLVLAIGAAVFSPLLLRINDLQIVVEKHSVDLRDHAKLPLHPVGETRINALETSLRERGQTNAANIRELDTKLQKEYGVINDAMKERVGFNASEIKDLDARLQREFGQLNSTIREQVDFLRKEFEEVRKNGSSITRERLAVLEHRAAQADAAKK